MKTGKWLILFCCLLVVQQGMTQDEGTLTKKERVVEGKSVYLFGGPTFQFGKNKGDYSGGLAFEAGYLFRLNRVLSIGPALSFTKFDYDESISDSFGSVDANGIREENPDADGNNMFQVDSAGPAYDVLVSYLEGGDLKLISAGLNIKLDLIPSQQGKRFTAYAIARPYLLISSRSEVTATVLVWYASSTNLEDDQVWSGGDPYEFLSPETPGLERWQAETELTGGINLGVGAEYAFPSGLALLMNGGLGLTLPITYINTSEFPVSLTNGYYHPDYPFVKMGFSTFNISVGLAYRF